MQVSTLLDAAVATGAGATITPQTVKHDEGVVQAEVAGTATVVVQGRLSPDASWFTIKTYTNANGSDKISLYPYMRANVSAWTSGAVSVWLQHD